MKRGDFVTIAVQGDYGKPRTALVIQTDAFERHASVTVLPVTSTLIDAPLLRVTVPADTASGLRNPSQIMVDKAITMKRDKLGPVIGHASGGILQDVERGLAIFLGIAK